MLSCFRGRRLPACATGTQSAAEQCKCWRAGPEEPAAFIDIAGARRVCCHATHRAAWHAHRPVLSVLVLKHVSRKPDTLALDLPSFAGESSAQLCSNGCQLLPSSSSALKCDISSLFEQLLLLGSARKGSKCSRIKFSSAIRFTTRCTHVPYAAGF